MAKQSIRLSDHFTYGKLLRFTLPSICMMVFTSIYGVVDGLFVIVVHRGNYRRDNAFDVAGLHNVFSFSIT